MDPWVIAHDWLVYAHIVTGAIGIVAFWVPIFGRKGGAAHRRWGELFARLMLATGAIAIAISITSLVAPLETHPKLADAVLVRGIFGWMMLYLAILTINLAWYGLECVAAKRDHARHRRPLNLALQAVLFLAALNCAVHGVIIAQPLMLGISIVGFATVATNLHFMLARTPNPRRWLKEHLKGLVGAGISVYTAFFAFGAVRFWPEVALSPGLWAVPLVVGLAIILFHWRDISLRTARASRQRTAAAAGTT
jgi:succinate dehydrogenase hydrophobic anchor subunit